jgi:hypothetical protein
MKKLIVAFRNFANAPEMIIVLNFISAVYFVRHVFSVRYLGTALHVWPRHGLSREDMCLSQGQSV